MKLACVLAIFCAFVSAAAGRKESRNYHAATLDQFANTHHTHVVTAGWLTYMKREDDGDLHLRICDDPEQEVMNAEHCVVAELIPPLKARISCVGGGVKRLVPEYQCNLHKGERVLVFGIRRFDDEVNHGWWEVHPVEKVEVLP